MSVQTSSEVLSRHDFNATYTNEYNTNQTNLSVISPTGQKKIKVAGGYVSLSGTATTGYVKLGFFDNTVIKVFAGSGTYFDFSNILVFGEQGGSLKLTSTLGNGINFLVVVNYEEVL